MELNWSTFVLEIVNFLILVWILKRFLYRPVLNILEARREKIQQTLNEATTHHADAIALENKYEKRLNDWAVEKQKIVDALQHELQTERSQKLEELQHELSTEREKNNVINQRHEVEILKQHQQNAHKQAARFVSLLFNTVASDEVQSRLFTLIIKTLEDPGQSQESIILDAFKNFSGSVDVSSAYPLSDEQKSQLENIFRSISDKNFKVNFELDPELIAGLRIIIDSRVIGLNLQDELSGFVDLINNINP